MSKWPKGLRDVGEELWAATLAWRGARVGKRAEAKARYDAARAAFVERVSELMMASSIGGMPERETTIGLTLDRLLAGHNTARPPYGGPSACSLVLARALLTLSDADIETVLAEINRLRRADSETGERAG